MRLKQQEVKGFEDGKIQGMKQGIEKGIKKGEQNKAIEIAKNSISQGLDNDTIALITGLDIQTVQSLRNNTKSN